MRLLVATAAIVATLLAGCTAEDSYDKAISCAAIYGLSASKPEGAHLQYIADWATRHAHEMGPSLGKSSERVASDLKARVEQERSIRARLSPEQQRRRRSDPNGIGNYCWNIYN